MSRERQNSGQRNLANKERPQQPPTRALLSSPGGQLSETRALEALLENKQYQALINRASTVTNAQNHDTVKLLLAQAHSAIATDYLSKNQLEQASLQFYKASALVINNTKLAELNNKLATAYHQNGRRLLSTDIDKGIVYLQESLKHDASNKQVENLLRQSQLMKKRLSEIDAGR